MDRYFTTRQGAIRRLFEIKRESAEGFEATVVGRRRDGVEVTGIDNVLLSARAGRLACFFASAIEDHVVFIS